jgi:septal ring factor EnvC (AmiA/AmiB activator)
MPEYKVNDAALQTMRSALNSFSAKMQVATAKSRVQCNQLRSRVEMELRGRQQELNRLQGIRPRSEEEMTSIRALIARADQSVREARRALGMIDMANDNIRGAERGLTNFLDPNVAASSSSLSRKVNALGNYCHKW